MPSTSEPMHAKVAAVAEGVVDSNESSAVAAAGDPSVSSAVAIQERRMAWDGKAYTKEEFQQWYGAAGGNLWGLATVKADTLLLSALHMTVLGQDQFISMIICLLGTHPDQYSEGGTISLAWG